MAQVAIEGAGGPARLKFYAVMSFVCLAIGIIGFMPTFFVPLAQGRFDRPPVFYFHGLLFFAWTAFFFAQSYMVMTGRVLAHREWGVFGAAVAALMPFSVVSVIIAEMHQTPPVAAGPGSASFASGLIAGMLFFGTCVVLALANTRRPAVHKRLMLLATLSLLGAPLARWNVVFFPPILPSGPPPPLLAVAWPGFATWALMLVAMAYDFRTEARVSRVYLVGVPITVLITVTSPLIGSTPAWLSAADWIKHILG